MPPILPDAIDLFLAEASRRPQKLAVEADGKGATYAELAARVGNYAAAFAQVAEPRIVIALPRGVDACAAILGTGLAGGFYAPVNDASPIDKLLRIVGQLEPNIIVAPQALADRLAEAAPNAIRIDPATLDRSATFTDRHQRHPISYIIFTSGSTGVPKGVVISRVALNHYVQWIKASESVLPEDRVAQFNNLAFDISVFDIYGAFCLGATLIPISRRSDRLMPARIIARERITAWASVPSVLNLMMTANQLTSRNLATIRRFTFAGERLLREHVEAIFAANPNIVIQNAYGPTETTVTMTGILLTQDHYMHACAGTSVSIGPEIPGIEVYLVGGSHPDEGEIFIAGPQVADGYWRDPERTAQSFRAIEIDGRMVHGYFSGDWAERHDGLVYFRERIDFQVKLNGYRIEMDEVAAAIRKCGWPTVCVFKRDESLVALIECADNEVFDPAALRTALAGQIEAYAIPSRIERVGMIPRNENDKIDRKLAAELFETLAREADGT